MICLKVLSSSAEDNEKNASIEEGLTACVEAKVRRIKLGLVMCTDNMVFSVHDL